MKIAVINDSVYPFFKGGAQKRVWEISRRLVQRGHQVFWYGMDYGATEVDGIELRPVSPAYQMYTEAGKRRIGQALRFAAKLDVREKVDIVDCMNFPYLHCFRAWWAAREQGVPFVITWFEFWGDYWYRYMGWRGGIGKVIERGVTRLPDQIIADSGKVKRQLVAVGARAEKVTIVPDGVDLAKIRAAEPSRRQYDVVYVGRMLQHKNVDVLVRALACLEGVTAAIIGTGTSKELCEKLATELRIQSRVKFLGHLPEDQDVYSILKSAKVLVIPSTQEGHPLVIPEAHACGIPVVGIEGVCNEFVTPGKTGYLCRLDAGSLGFRIQEAIQRHPTFREDCLARAKMYDWDVITTRVETVYENTIWSNR